MSFDVYLKSGYTLNLLLCKQPEEAQSFRAEIHSGQSFQIFENNQ